MNTDEAVADLASRNLTWAIPWKAVELIARSEGCELSTYKCSANTWTIGWGETNGVQPGMTWTKEQADRRFNEEVNKYAERIKAMCSNYASPNQLGAMTSLAYNIGLDAFQKKSTVFKAHNADQPEAAARAFNLWNKARVNGVLVPLRGLTVRRAKEAALYLTPEPNAPKETSTQAVQDESNLTKSPMNISGATTIAVGGITGFSGILDGLSPVVGRVKEFATAFEVNPSLMFAVILIGAGAVNIYWRYKQREGGWA